MVRVTITPLGDVVVYVEVTVLEELDGGVVAGGLVEVVNVVSVDD